MTKTLEILPELRDLIDLPSETEQKELEKSILREGIRDKIVVWLEKNAIIDGHNRYRIAKAHNVEFDIQPLSFSNIEDVKDWMISNQLARRNLTKDRFEYFIGLLYNARKQDPTKKRTKKDEGKTTSQEIADQHGISERTVRRAGDVATGLDRVAELKGKIAKMNQLDGKGAYTKQELAEIGKLDPKIAPAVIKEVDRVKAAAKASAPKIPQNVEKYPVAFCAPHFEGMNFSINGEPRPPLAENATLYMKVDDPYMQQAFRLCERWGLAYQATFVFPESEGYEGMWSDVKHTSLLAFTKGTVAGPAKKSAAHSLQGKGNADEGMIKLMEKYHPTGKKVDMRKNPAKGWDTPNK